MAYSDDQLEAIFDRSGGDCHLCGKQLAFGNYACHGSRGAWEVDHSRARARGGSDYQRNLRPACISCNRSKQASCSRSTRRTNGMSRSPLSHSKRRQARAENTILGLVGGGLAGAAFGPGGALVGAVAGAICGESTRPR